MVPRSLARRSRRQALLLVVLLVVGSGVALWQWKLGLRRGPERPPWTRKISAATRAQRPNLLLVVYDARRRDDFSFGPFGNARGDTPFLAAFKDDAVYFEDAVAPGSWTVPVHASMFSGLSVCELGDDYYNPGWASLPRGFLSLPEILGTAGYQTVAYADHPYFYNSHADVSLIRGFEQFNVISDFERYPSATNVATRSGGVERVERLDGMPPLAIQDIAREVAGFNAGTRRPDPEADLDPVTGVVLARLPDLYRRSAYFQKRYAAEFDAKVFAAPRERPYFLFLNLHMNTVALPEPGLFGRWAVETVMLNALRQGRTLSPPPPGGTLAGWLDANAARLKLGHAPLPDRLTYLKHAFDNRFYDATFEAIWRHLKARGLLENTVTVVTSDHGMSFRGHGENLYLHSGARPYEYLVRVPLVVRFPPGSELARFHGRRSELVSLTDVFSTLLELGLGPSVFERELPIRGLSLVTRLRARSFEPYLLAESAVGPNPYDVAPGTLGYTKAVLAGGLKLIHAPELFRTPRAAAGWPITVRPGEWPFAQPRPALDRVPEPLNLLYDLSRDPHERINLAEERPADVGRLQALVRSWACRSLPWSGESPIWHGESLATLRSLGYIQ